VPLLPARYLSIFDSIPAPSKTSNALKIKTKTRRSGLSVGALRMSDSSEVARDFSLAWSLTPQVRKL
ncbi:hypothetical protein OM313_12140, partial [Escherichia albertii]|nr:hypothetical protein [Escherichia albertii]